MKTYTLLQLTDAVKFLDEATEIRMDCMRGNTERARKLSLYEATALIEAKSAEDAFDLDNNPMRRSRNQIVNFVCRRTMTVGDILLNNGNGVYRVCKPRGWEIVGDDFNWAMPQITNRYTPDLELVV